MLARLSASLGHRAHLGFAKSTHGWIAPSPCRPEQVDRWTGLVVATYTQLWIARGRVVDLRLPWEHLAIPNNSPNTSALGFVDSWKDLLGAIETKREELR